MFCELNEFYFIFKKRKCSLCSSQIKNALGIPSYFYHCVFFVCKFVTVFKELSIWKKKCQNKIQLKTSCYTALKYFKFDEIKDNVYYYSS